MLEKTRMVRPTSRPAVKPASSAATRNQLSPDILAVIIAIVIFGADILLPVPGAVAVLYTAVILLVADGGSRRNVVASGTFCGFLAVFAFLVQHYHAPFGQADVRFIVSLVAIGITTLLASRNRAAKFMLCEQAGILELTHDTVIIRNDLGIIQYWNDGAERLYGWRKSEAIGQDYRKLLQPDYPVEAARGGLAADRQWSGEMTCLHRQGHRIILATRWLARTNANGNSIGVIETSSDLTAQRRSEAERQRSEKRYRTIFDAAGFAIWESDWSETHRIIQAATAKGRSDLSGWLAENRDVLLAASRAATIEDINSSALKLFDAAHTVDLPGGNIASLLSPSSEAGLAGIFAALWRGERKVECEVQFRTLTGKIVDVVLSVTLQSSDENWNRVFVMALDVTDRNLAQAKLRQTVSELAHVSRVTMLGQLAASIAHEVNQPLSAIITYGKSGERWLKREAPDAPEVAECLSHIITNSTRAAEVIGRVRSLAKNTAPETADIRLEELIAEAVSLVQRDILANHVTVLQLVEPYLPAARGDKIQIQQVVMNLIMNAIQAMGSAKGIRKLTIEIERDQKMLSVKIRDSGTGIKKSEMARLFDPFVTTKQDGMGMGLSICRTIIEAHGGKISASNNSDLGAVFAFTLPANLTVEALS